MCLKSLRSRGKENVRDRISELPDALLLHILSFLETKCCVNTGVLSRRWRNVWASIPNIDICRGHFSRSGDLFNFVERVLSFHDASDIQKFRLHCLCDDVIRFSHIDRWVRNVVRHNVVELDLSIELSVLADSYQGQTFELPESVFTCKTLRVLELGSNFITNVPASGCLPNLKFLRVVLEEPTNDSICKLFSSCPVLEDLAIEGSHRYGVVFNFNIIAPELRRLRISLDYDDFDKDGDIFFILAPKLETFDLREEGFSSYHLENANYLFKAKIYLPEHYASALAPCFVERARRLLAGIHNVKHLTLSIHLLEPGLLPAFDYLNHLKLDLYECNHWNLLTELLKRSPKLEYLVIQLYDGLICDEDYGHLEHGWNPPAFVPVCLSLHLKTISILRFEGREDEMEAAKYLLKHGKVLNRMNILTNYFQPKKKELYREFCWFERETKLHAAAKDRIGKLPNGVPCHILSFLHTKGTVKTTVLSTRWMNVWAFTPNLNFNDRDLRWLDSAAFMGFVDHVLLFHGSLNIHKFSLRWSDAEDLACIVGWIHTRHNVVERDLLHLYVNDVADGLFELPQCPVTSKTLVVLKLM
ncbi:hypothetical protein FF2_030770 [Malus domestica]